jgi:hypothetical protein
VVLRSKGDRRAERGKFFGGFEEKPSAVGGFQPRGEIPEFRGALHVISNALVL